MKQFEFDINDKPRKEHGGELLIGKRKSRRPLSTKLPIHLVMRTDLAQGARSLLKHRQLIERILKKVAHRFRIQIYEKAIVSNHIHLLIRGKRREDIQNFLRVITGHIAQEILQKLPLPPSHRENKFWQTRIYSRLLTWGREFHIVKKYVVQNILEAAGLVAYKRRPRATSYQ